MINFICTLKSGQPVRHARIYPATDQEIQRASRHDVITTEYQLYRKEPSYQVKRIRSIASPAPLQINHIQSLAGGPRREVSRRNGPKTKQFKTPNLELISGLEESEVSTLNPPEEFKDDIKIISTWDANSELIGRDVQFTNSDRSKQVQKNFLKEPEHSNKDKKVSISFRHQEIQDIVTNDQVDVTQIVHRVPWKYSTDYGPDPPPKPKRKLCRRKTETDLDKFKILESVSVTNSAENDVPKTAMVISTNPFVGFYSSNVAQKDLPEKVIRTNEPELVTGIDLASPSDEAGAENVASDEAANPAQKLTSLDELRSSAMPNYSEIVTESDHSVDISGNFERLSEESNLGRNPSENKEIEDHRIDTNESESKAKLHSDSESNVGVEVDNDTTQHPNLNEDITDELVKSHDSMDNEYNRSSLHQTRQSTESLYSKPVAYVYAMPSSSPKSNSSEVSTKNVEHPAVTEEVQPSTYPGMEEDKMILSQLCDDVRGDEKPNNEVIMAESIEGTQADVNEALTSGDVEQSDQDALAYQTHTISPEVLQGIENSAARTIQATYKGYRTRKHLKEQNGCQLGDEARAETASDDVANEELQPSEIVSLQEEPNAKDVDVTSENTGAEHMKQNEEENGAKDTQIEVDDESKHSAAIATLNSSISNASDKTTRFLESLSDLSRRNSEELMSTHGTTDVDEDVFFESVKKIATQTNEETQQNIGSENSVQVNETIDDVLSDGNSPISEERDEKRANISDQSNSEDASVDVGQNILNVEQDDDVLHENVSADENRVPEENGNNVACDGGSNEGEKHQGAEGHVEESVAEENKSVIVGSTDDTSDANGVLIDDIEKDNEERDEIDETVMDIEVKEAEAMEQVEETEAMEQVEETEAMEQVEENEVQLNNESVTDTLEDNVNNDIMHQESSPMDVPEEQSSVDANATSEHDGGKERLEARQSSNLEKSVQTEISSVKNEDINDDSNFESMDELNLQLITEGIEKSDVEFDNEPETVHNDLVVEDESGIKTENMILEHTEEIETEQKWNDSKSSEPIRIDATPEEFSSDNNKDMIPNDGGLNLDNSSEFPDNTLAKSTDKIHADHDLTDGGSNLLNSNWSECEKSEEMVDEHNVEQDGESENASKLVDGMKNEEKDNDGALVDLKEPLESETAKLSDEEMELQRAEVEKIISEADVVPDSSAMQSLGNLDNDELQSPVEHQEFPVHEEEMGDAFENEAIEQTLGYSETGQHLTESTEDVTKENDEPMIEPFDVVNPEGASVMDQCEYSGEVNDNTGGNQSINDIETVSPIALELEDPNVIITSEDVEGGVIGKVNASSDCSENALQGQLAADEKDANRSYEILPDGVSVANGEDGMLCSDDLEEKIQDGKGEDETKPEFDYREANNKADGSDFNDRSVNESLVPDNEQTLSSDKQDTTKLNMSVENEAADSSCDFKIETSNGREDEVKIISRPSSVDEHSSPSISLEVSNGNIADELRINANTVDVDSAEEIKNEKQVLEGSKLENSASIENIGDNLSPEADSIRDLYEEIGTAGSGEEHISELNETGEGYNNVDEGTIIEGPISDGGKSGPVNSEYLRDTVESNDGNGKLVDEVAEVPAEEASEMEVETHGEPSEAVNDDDVPLINGGLSDEDGAKKEEAAVIIQAGVRGHLVRKQLRGKKDVEAKPGESEVEGIGSIDDMPEGNEPIKENSNDGEGMKDDGDKSGLVNSEHSRGNDVIDDVDDKLGENVAEVSGEEHAMEIGTPEKSVEAARTDGNDDELLKDGSSGDENGMKKEEAVVIIQAGIRGHLVRKQLRGKEDVEAKTAQREDVQEVGQGSEEEERARSDKESEADVTEIKQVQDGLPSNADNWSVKKLDRGENACSNSCSVSRDSSPSGREGLADRSDGRDGAESISGRDQNILGDREVKIEKVRQSDVTDTPAKNATSFDNSEHVKDVEGPPVPELAALSSEHVDEWQSKNLVNTNYTNAPSDRHIREEPSKQQHASPEKRDSNNLRNQVLSPRKVKTMHQKPYQFKRPSSASSESSESLAKKAAATKIQAGFRGYMIRKQIKVTPYQFKRPKSCSGQADNSKDFRNLENAQSNVDASKEADSRCSPEVDRPKSSSSVRHIGGADQGRGYGSDPNLRRIGSSRIYQFNRAAAPVSADSEAERNRPSSSSGNNDILHSSEYPRTELDKAATKIQASFRGYKTRTGIKRRHEE